VPGNEDVRRRLDAALPEARHQAARCPALCADKSVAPVPEPRLSGRMCGQQRHRPCWAPPLSYFIFKSATMAA
jgi:hypothetical protein